MGKISTKYRVSVFGLGYVGSVSAACLAADGWEVIGVDSQEFKTNLIRDGKSPVVEPSLDEIILDAVNSGRLSTTTSAKQAITESDISLICVGTPSCQNGSLDLQSITRVCDEIGLALRSKDNFHVVVIRSTVLPGTTREVIIPTLEAASAKKHQQDFGLAVNPEFLREGSAVSDFYCPPKIVIGAADKRSGAAIAALYRGIEAPTIQTNLEMAEMVKYVDNAWHALKVAFSNEVGSVCKALSIDSHRLMDIFCQDTKLNLSPQYLKPGFAFGGSCLPKDLRALTFMSRKLDLELPVLNNILLSNRIQVERAINIIEAKGCRRIGILGISFKAGTDDLRESPIIELIERLIGKGYKLRLYDTNVNLARTVGANRDYILKSIPHISTLLFDTIDEVLGESELIVIGNSDPDFEGIPFRLKDEQLLLDMVRLLSSGVLAHRYEGINW